VAHIEAVIGNHGDPAERLAAAVERAVAAFVA
jgi:hypothetical protein